MTDTDAPSAAQEPDAAPSAAATAAAVLQWYAEMGVDAALGTDGIDWFAMAGTPPGAALRDALRNTSQTHAAPHQTAQPSSNASTQSTADRRPAPFETNPVAKSAAPPPAASQASGPPAQTLAQAQAAAATATSIETLGTAIASFEGCGLKATAKNTCVYRGAQHARVAVIGEAPGRDEDLQGRPFVGRAGQLLDKMLKAIALDETNTHITNIVYWRPPGNRAPTPQEAMLCRPFLERQIELVDPDVIILMGGSAAKQILSTSDGIMRTRGKWRKIEIGGRERQALATLHPAYLLRTPAAKHMVWKDLLAVKKIITEQ